METEQLSNGRGNSTFHPTKEDRDAATRLAVERARTDLLAFVLLIDPSFCVGPHHRLICDELMKIESGDNDRLMIFVAPRSSKSLISSVYFSAWALGRNPNWQWMQLSHSSDLAGGFGRKIRDIIASPMYQAIFPDIKIRQDHRAAADWALADTTGSFMAAGVGSGIAGKGANCAVIDDPISEQDAFSKAKREAVNDWYPAGLRSRLMPGGRIVIIQTRWHEFDLSGYLLEESKKNPDTDQWRVIEIPALNTAQSLERLLPSTEALRQQGYVPDNYPDPEIDESFWPAPEFEGAYYWATKDLMRTKASTPEYQWDAVYMQRPSALEGGIFKVHYWKHWTDPEPPELDYTLMSLDTAFSTRTTADFSAITRWGVFADGADHTNVICLGAKKGRWDYPTLRERVIDEYIDKKPDAIVIEKKASGQSLIQELRQAGLPIFEYQPDRDKVARAHACVSLFHNGRVWIPIDKKWASELIDECRVFDNGAHDDLVDATTQAILWLRTSGYVHHTEDALLQWDESATMRKKKRRYY